MRLEKVFFVLFVLILSFISTKAISQEKSNLIQEALAKGKKVAGEELHTLPLLKDYYQSHGPVWIGADGPNARALDLIRAIENSTKEGLSPTLYHLPKIKELLTGLSQDKSNPSLVADTELLLMDAFFSLAFHYEYGAVGQNTAQIRWYASKSDIDSADIGKPLNDFLPKNEGYAKLRAALAQYEDLATKTKWPKIEGLSKGHKLKVGDRDTRIVAIRERFGIAGDDLYEPNLEQAVIKFQKDNGLLDDGVIGFRTIDAMNVPIEDRICQIKTNLDRLRAMSDIFDEARRVVVNVPAFWLETYENGELVLDMKVIDGMKKRKTPMLSSEIVHLIFSPKWYVPDKILFEDKLPHIRKDVAFLSKNKMRVFEKGGEEVDPETIDWTQFESQDIPYRVVQESGDANALGRVKFIFPNRYDVYLHDTPQKELFQNAQRSFSSGCMRIEKPVELASLLLKDKPEWNAEKIKDAMNRSYEKVVPLTNHMPIHVIYVTSWVDKNGELQFREDIYGYDRPYKKLLCE